MFVLRTSVAFFLTLLVGTTLANSFGGHEALSDALLREMVARMGNDLVDPRQRDYIDLPSQRLGVPLPEGIPPRGVMPDLPPGLDYEDLALSPSLRDREFLAHSSLMGTVFGKYGAGNGKSMQRLIPTGTGPKATSELKTDGVLPAYCNPPNPCPLGYTAADGCFEEFENSASFSRDFQSEQECTCDTEHMFRCEESSRDQELTALAMSIQNEGTLDDTIDNIMARLAMPSQRVVAKKAAHISQNYNPYLQGEKLPVAAKKGAVTW